MKKNIYMKYWILVTLIFFVIGLEAQTDKFKDLNGEYFYFKTNTASNYFDQPKYEIDSIFVFKEMLNDTIISWTTGMARPVDATQLEVYIQNNEFNQYFQRGITQSNGKTITHKMKPNYFKISGDTLFQLTSSYSITQDSFQILKDTKTSKEVTEINKTVTTLKFRPIFSPTYFDTEFKDAYIELTDSCPNLIYLDRVWETETGKYFEFHIENKCGYYGNHWGFIVDRNLNIIKYGGYYSKSYKFLNKDNLTFKRKDDQ